MMVVSRSIITTTYILNNVTAKKNKDGSISSHFDKDV